MAVLWCSRLRKPQAIFFGSAGFLVGTYKQQNQIEEPFYLP